MRILLAAILLASFAASAATCPTPATATICTEWTLWIFLADGELKTNDFPDLQSCFTVQGIIQDDVTNRGDKRVERMMCLPSDYRALTDPAQRIPPPPPIPAPR